MFNSALLTLKSLQYRSRIRRMVNSLKTLKGILYFVFALILIACWIGPQLFLIIYNPKGVQTIPDMMDQGNIKILAPLLLMAFCLMQIVFKGGEKMLYFTPSEIDFLFPGPFKRSELMIYKLQGMFITTLFPAFIFSIFAYRLTFSWISLFLGFYGALLFIQLFGLTTGMLFQNISERAFDRWRKVILIIVIAAIGIVIYKYIKSGREVGYFTLIGQFQASTLGTILFFPFKIFTNALLAQTFLVEFLPWFAAGLLVNILLVVFIIRLDANFLETAVGVSQKIYQRVQRAKNTRGAQFTVKSEAKFSPPMLPWLGGAGPIIWRQLTNAIRNSKSFLFFLFIFACCLGPMLFMEGLSEQVAMPFLFMIIWVSLISTEAFGFDFRSEMSRMDWLKMLPLSSTSITLGEILVPTLMYLLIELVLFTGLGIFAAESRMYLLIFYLYLIPINFIIFCVDNFIFLLFPIRMVPGQPGDFQHFGRVMMIFMLKILLTVAIGGVSAGIGGLAYWLTAYNFTVFVIVTWVILMITAVCIFPAVVWAYERFDLSVDTPA